MTKKTKQAKTLIERYTILKPKLEKHINKLIGIQKYGDFVDYSEKSQRLHREALELLKDTFSGEDGEIT